MHGTKDAAPIPTGRLVYRLTIPSENLASDPATRGLVEPAKVTVWAGPGKHVLCYNLHTRGVCNVVLTTADDTPNVQRPPGPQNGSMEALRREFEGWDSVLTRVFEMAEHVVYWPFVRVREGDEWIASGGRGVLVGDAAHGMLPHMYVFIFPIFTYRCNGIGPR
jgi:salicylate hydroxylase